MKIKILPQFISIVILILFIASFTMNSFAATESDKAALQNQINQAKNELDEISDSKDEAETELEKISSQVTNVENQIAELKIQLSNLKEEIAAKEDEIKAEEDEIAAKDELLKQRMVALYEAGDTSYLDVLFNSEDLVDFISGYSAIQTILEADTKLINELEEKKAQLENDKANLEDDKQKVEDIKNQQEIKNATLVTLKEQKQTEINKLSSDEQSKQKELDDYNSQMKEINEALAKAYNASNSAGLKFDGSFIWPCVNKTVSSGMKIRNGRWHKGIDILANFENVYASASGYAYNALNPGGYGIYVIVIHGDGYVTLYGHLNKSYVSDGQYVSQGAVIAQSGNTGNGVTHLHFEIRKATSFSNFFGNNWLDPLDYLPGGYTLQSGALTPS